MKRLVLFLGIIVATSFLTWALKAQTKPQTTKMYTVSLRVEQWNGLLDGLQEIKNRLSVSDLPARDVTYMKDSLLTVIQTEFVRQINAQLAAENKKDTIKPKKNK